MRTQYQKPKGVEPKGSHELAVGDDMLVKPTLGGVAKDALQGNAPALNPATVEEEYSSHESEKGKHSVTNANVSTEMAPLNIGKGLYIYGIDEGAKEAGIAIVEAITGEVVFKGVIHLRDDVKRLMRYRREHRRERRRHLRYRANRFNNRRRKEGWIPPSIKVKKDNILRVIRELAKRYPPSKFVYEEASFNIRKLVEPNVNGKEYQKNLWNALIYRAGNKCEVCGKVDRKLQMHHIVPLSKGGSNSVTNILIVCEQCHKGIHEGRIKIEKKDLQVRYPAVAQAGKTYLKNELSKLAPVEVVYGYQTKEWREKMGLEKTHWDDAIAIIAKGKKVIDKTQPSFCFAKRHRPYREAQRRPDIKEIGGLRRGDVVNYYRRDGTVLNGYIYGFNANGTVRINNWNGKRIIKFSKISPKRCERVLRDPVVVVVS